MPIQKYWSGTAYTIFDADDSKSVDSLHFRMNGSILEVSQDGSTWNPVSMSANDILTSLKTVDGSGSGLDADTLDSYETNMANSVNTVAVRNASGYLYAARVYGAVYNDYAEYRQAKEFIEPGYVVTEDGYGYITQSIKRCDKAAMIVTDTYGFGIGKQEINGEYSLPIAVAGRVLCYKDDSKFKIGDAVCSGKDGLVSKMKWYEKLLFPERILGIVSEVPTYDTWGSDKIEVNERIWIKI